MRDKQCLRTIINTAEITSKKWIAYVKIPTALKFLIKA